MSKRAISFLIVLVCSQFLTACASYKSSFACPDASGAGCRPMDEVDLMISNGKIEEFNNPEKNKGCCSSCYTNRAVRYLPDRVLREPEITYSNFDEEIN